MDWASVRISHSETPDMLACVCLVLAVKNDVSEAGLTAAALSVSRVSTLLMDMYAVIDSEAHFALEAKMIHGWSRRQLRLGV